LVRTPVGAFVPLQRTMVDKDGQEAVMTFIHEGRLASRRQTPVALMIMT
jgi:hypothetical protein